MSGQVALPVGQKRKAPSATGDRTKKGFVVFMGFHMAAQTVAFCEALATAFDGADIRALPGMDPQVHIQANGGRKPLGAAFKRAAEGLVSTVFILVGCQRVFAAVAFVAAFDGAQPGPGYPAGVQDESGQGIPALSLVRFGLRPCGETPCLPMSTQVHSHSAIGDEPSGAAGNRTEPGLGDIMRLHMGFSVAGAEEACRTTFNGTQQGLFSGVGAQMLFTVLPDIKSPVTAVESAQPGLLPGVPLHMDSTPGAR